MGGSSEAAALAGVRVSRVILSALVTSGVVAGLGGLLLTSQLSTGDPTVGPGYLLPVIAAVFLGSTQFRGGRFNIWGTVVAAYVLAVGVKGLQLAGLPDLDPRPVQRRRAAGRRRPRRMAQAAGDPPGGHPPADP